MSHTEQGRALLIVEDDTHLRDLLYKNLSSASYQCTAVADAATALQKMSDNTYDAVVLDLMLPDGDGMDICRQMRDDGDFTPVLMLTSLASESDRVLGLEMGADDYLSKPFSFRELKARLNALVRRARHFQNNLPPTNGDQALILGDLHIHLGKRTVAINGKSVNLTAKEFDLLLYLARKPGQVFSRDQLLQSVWGYQYSGYEHTVNSHINRLRNKIEQNPQSPEYVLTVWGIGYKFAESM